PTPAPDAQPTRSLEPAQQPADDGLSQLHGQRWAEFVTAVATDAARRVHACPRAHAAAVLHGDGVHRAMPGAEPAPRAALPRLGRDEQLPGEPPRGDAA